MKNHFYKIEVVKEHFYSDTIRIEAFKRFMRHLFEHIGKHKIYYSGSLNIKKMGLLVFEDYNIEKLSHCHTYKVLCYDYCKLFDECCIRTWRSIFITVYDD